METGQKTGKEIHRSVVGKSVRAGIHELDLDGPGAKLIAGAEMALDEGLFSWFTYREIGGQKDYAVFGYCVIHAMSIEMYGRIQKTDSLFSLQ